jgi:hypothetical protein
VAFFLFTSLANLIVFYFFVMTLLLGGFNEAAFRRRLWDYPPASKPSCNLHTEFSEKKGA